SICTFFLHVTAPPELYTLSLHDALPISALQAQGGEHSSSVSCFFRCQCADLQGVDAPGHQRCGGIIDQPVPLQSPQARESGRNRSEEHTSELQSRENLVCRLLLEKKNKT